LIAIATTSLALSGVAAGCGSTSSGSSPQTSPSKSAATYTVDIRPQNFPTSTTIDNPYFPLVPGTRQIYEGNTPEGRQRTVVEVTRDTKRILGIKNMVVHDIVTLDGKPSEDTYDWYAQDKDGNVWYFGEATKKTGAGGKADTKGSFEAGVDNALPGIIMEGHPKVGDSYRQEYYQGVAEDRADVLSTSASATVAAGAYKDLVKTKDYTLLDSAAPIENKYFARGVGFILVEHITGPPERVELLRVENF
jgi:hypothetical protein